jgi:hypothetical protein
MAVGNGEHPAIRRFFAQMKTRKMDRLQEMELAVKGMLSRDQSLQR